VQLQAILLCFSLRQIKNTVYVGPLLIYRVIHKSLRDFRHLRYSSRDGHAEEEHVNRGRDTPRFCPTLQVYDISTFRGSMSTEGETLHVSVLPYRCTIFQPFVGACQQRERHSMFLSYLTGVRYFKLSWEHVNRGRDTPRFCPTLQVYDISTFRGSMSTEGETLHVSVLPYRCTIFQPFVGACQQRERHSKFLSYLTGVRYSNLSWEHVNRGRDTPRFCPTL